MYIYSVIIAHKNLMGLLRRTLDSIPQRSDIQTIIVDDNSDIAAEEWAAFMKNYEQEELVLTKEGRGAGYARNVGLTRARGRWIIFADADGLRYKFPCLAGKMMRRDFIEFTRMSST